MTDLYTDEGVLDYAEAARSLANLNRLGSDKLRDDKTQQITAAALLDIAVSLNAIVQLANGYEYPLNDEREVGPDGQPLGDPQRGDDEDDEPVDVQLDIGDRVEVTLDDEQHLTAAGTIRALGESEGDEWAEVAWDVDEGEPESVTKVWATSLRPEPPAEKGDDEGAEPASSIADDEPGGRDLVDDIDSDFGPAQPVKPAKGKGKKKGKG